MNRSLLERPFPADLIRQREGNFGQMLDYVEAHAVIQRLNDAFEGEWAFEITNHQIENDEVVVLGKLSAGSVVKMHFGSSRITRHRESSEPVSLGDDLKAAATDALKKAATLLGVGLHLYGAGTAAGGKSSASETASPVHNPAPSSQPRLSAKQHRFLLQLARQTGLSRTELDDRCRQQFGTTLDHLPRSAASALIDQLQAPSVAA